MLHWYSQLLLFCPPAPCLRSKGATLGCFKRTCRASYHLACARKYNCLLQASTSACCRQGRGGAALLCGCMSSWPGPAEQHATSEQAGSTVSRTASVNSFLASRRTPPSIRTHSPTHSPLHPHTPTPQVEPYLVACPEHVDDLPEPYSEALAKRTPGPQPGFKGGQCPGLAVGRGWRGGAWGPAVGRGWRRGGCGFGCGWGHGCGFQQHADTGA